MAAAEWAPWAIAVVGVIANHVFSEARERRKEFRSRLDKLTQQLADLEEKGRRFHTGQAHDAALAREIAGEISRIERSAMRLVPVDRLSEAVIEHRRAFTFQNFDASSFEPQQPGSSILAEIEATTTEYESALETEYIARHPSRFPYYRLVPSVDSSLGYVIVAFVVGVLLGGVWVFLAHSVSGNGSG